MATDPIEIINYLLPHIVTAGAYSAEIQSRVSTHDAKGGVTIFHHALSDADLSIQAFLEVVLLARFPELHYFSEEQDKSLNKKYFKGSSSIEVLLDPIDGTRPYIDGREFYQIIVTIHDEAEIVGAISYMPRRNRCYVASKGHGAFILTRDDITHGRQGSRCDVTKGMGPVLVFNAPRLVAKLSGSFSVKDIVTAYVEEPGRYYSTDLLEGTASAVVHETCQAIDGGALAFISCEAGAIVTDFHGKPMSSFRALESRVIREIVVSVSSEVHARVLAALR